MMGSANEDTELANMDFDRSDKDDILSQFDLSSFHLPDTISLKQTTRADDRSGSGWKPNLYGSVDQQQDGSTISFYDVTVTMNEKTILNRVSGMATAGEMLAIMGPSGAGKSTLLSVMAARIPITSGCVTLNGQPVRKSIRREISYVLQSDCFYPSLTLREVLTYASLLRLPDSMPYKQKICRMLEIVDLLDLNKCLDTRMGSGMNVIEGGLSGGERKRASIACELIANTKLLLIDEPTSGLDSAIAHDLMASLQKLSTNQRKTIVTTIHQPSSKIFHMFSKVLLLVEGQVAYFGSGERITDFFANIGLSFDPRDNPADFIMEKIKTDRGKLKKMIDLSYTTRTREGWSKKLLESMAHLSSGCAAKKDSKTAAQLSSKGVRDDAKWPTGFWTQYTTLTRRSFALSRDRFLSILNLVHIVNVLIIGMEWYQLPRAESTMNDRIGLIFFLNVLTETSRCLPSQYLVFDTWGVFENERSAGVYRLSAYYLATVTSEVPSMIALGVFYSAVCYWMTGLAPVLSCFVLFILLLILGMFIAQSLGFLISIVIHRRDFAVSVTSTVIMTLIMSGGFYNAHAHAWFDWVRYVSFMSRIWSTMVVIEWVYSDRDFQCEPANSTIYPQYCTNGTTLPGSAFLSRHNVDDTPIGVNIAISFSILISLHVASYLCLRFMKPRPRS